MSASSCRRTEHSGYFRIDIYDKDHSSSDDHIGDQYLYFSYNPNTDKWTISWDDAGNKSDSLKGHHTLAVPSGGGVKNSFTRTWDSDGEVEFYFGAKWE